VGLANSPTLANLATNTLRLPQHAGRHVTVHNARRDEARGLATGNSLLMWFSVMVATEVGPGSVLMSVLVLLTGGACIVLGFRTRLTILRHYGLTLVLLSVLKLAVVDVASQNSIIRVISLAAAGVVCFVLSLLYNRFAQEQRRESNQAPMGPGSI